MIALLSKRPSLKVIQGAMLLIGHDALATSYTHVPSIAEAIVASSVIVHGTVSDVDSCIGSRAWTFITLDVHQVLRGSLSGGESMMLQGGETFGGLMIDNYDPLTDLVVQSCDAGKLDWEWKDPLEVVVTDEGSEPAGPTLVSGGCSIEEDWSGGTAKLEDSGAQTPMALTSQGAFTFRLPYGEYADGTQGTIIDTPAFSVGEEVVVMLTYDVSGEHLFIPLSWMGWSVYRVFRGSGGQSAVADGFGHTLHYRTDDIPVRGRGDLRLRYLYWQDEPFTSGQVSGALNDIASASTWTGTQLAVGPWRGRLRAVGDGEFPSTCWARVSGLVESDALEFQGKCNADWVGATHVLVEGALGGSGWSGTVTFTPTAWPSSAVTVDWSSSEEAYDSLEGGGSGTEVVLGETLVYDIALRAAFVGNRPLRSFPAFKNYVLSVANAHQTSAGIGATIDMNEETCGVTVSVVGVAP